MTILQRLIAAIFAIAVVLIITNVQLSGRSELQQAAKSPEDIVSYFNELAFIKADPESAVSKYVSPDIIVHNSSVTSSLNDLLDHLKWRIANNTVLKIIKDKDNILVIYNSINANKIDLNGIDVLRVKDGFIVEHWRFTQPK